MTWTIDVDVFSLANQDKRLIYKYNMREILKKNYFVIFLRKFIKNLKSKFNIKNKKITKNTAHELHIIYRHVYISENKDRFPNKLRPEGFSHEKCLLNLLDSVSNSQFKSKVKITIFYNGTRSEFEKDECSAILKSSEIDVRVRLIRANSALESALIMLREIKNIDINKNDILYILENDYIHAADWLTHVFQIFNSNISFDYISLYDHPDRYLNNSNYSKSTLFTTSSRHWITAPSTCGTFLLKYETYLRDFDYLYTYEPDHILFSRLTGKLKRVLLTPVPGLSLHSMAEHLDTVQNFQDYFIGN